MTPASTTAAPGSALLQVSDLSVHYGAGQDAVHAVRDVSLSVAPGEFLGLVGESGSGKSTLGFAITRLLKDPARISSGRILFQDRDISELQDEELRRVRSGGFAMVLQSGMNALNPVRTVYHHFADVIRAHQRATRAEITDRAIDLLQQVDLNADVLRRYPHELSGGMRQRTAIAIALSLQPRLMVFDEPTTALDVLVQRSVVDTIRRLQEEIGFTAILISHDLGLVLETTDRVLVMRNGEVIERGDAMRILTDPQHDYTRMLLDSYVDPRGDRNSLRERILARSDDRAGDEGQQPAAEPTAGTEPSSGTEPTAGTGWAQRSLTVTEAVKIYPGGRRQPPVTAVDQVSFELHPGEAVALVGASGSGKSTLARLATGMERPSSGRVDFGDVRVDRLNRRGLADYRRSVQMVFQDPYSALNPLQTVAYVLSRPLVNHRGLRDPELMRRVGDLLERVGLTPTSRYATKLPHQLSGGERQRVVIARALASEPEVIIADEPVSMLDVSLRAGVLALLEDLRRDLGMSMLYITHDLHSAQAVTDRALVLQHGRLVESGDTAEVLRSPTDEYTRALIAAIPNPHLLLDDPGSPS